MGTALLLNGDLIKTSMMMMMWMMLPIVMMIMLMVVVEVYSRKEEVIIGTGLLNGDFAFDKNGHQ